VAAEDHLEALGAAVMLVIQAAQDRRRHQTMAAVVVVEHRAQVVMELAA